MRIAALLLTVSLLMAVPGAIVTAQNHGSDAFLITPGVGIGPVKIGMSVSDAVTILGSPKATLPTRQGWMFAAVLTESDATAYFWYDYVGLTSTTAKLSPGGLRVITDHVGRIVWVQADYSPAYHTASGIHAGMREPQVLSIMGRPERTMRPDRKGHFLVYRGIAVAIPDDPSVQGAGTVAQVAVW